MMNIIEQEPTAAGELTSFLRPRVVAVVGASRDRNKIGSQILHNLVATRFTGTIVPVHPVAPDILGVKAYPRVTAIPMAVDLAIVAVPAVHVEAVVDDCFAKGVRAICIITAGFGECGEEDRCRLSRGRTQLHGPPQHRSRDHAECDLLPGLSSGRACCVDSAATRRLMKERSEKPCCASRRWWESARRSRNST